MIEEEARRTLDELRGARLEPSEWSGVLTALERLESSVARADEPAASDALIRLSGAAFAAKVRQQMPSGGIGAPGVAPTKQTTVLPAVGFVCGGILLGTGWSLGGGLVLAGCALFAVFIFAVAFAGSRVAHRASPVTAIESAVPAAPEILAAIDRVISSSGFRPSGP